MLRKRLRGQRCVCFCFPGDEFVNACRGRALCKNGDRCVRKEVRGGKFRVHNVASSPLIHVGMCRMIKARSIC